MDVYHTMDLIRELSNKVYEFFFLPYLSLRSVVVKDHEYMFPRKKSSNSLASWVKELIKNNFK